MMLLNYTMNAISWKYSDTQRQTDRVMSWLFLSLKTILTCVIREQTERQTNRKIHRQIEGHNRQTETDRHRSMHV